MNRSKIRCKAAILLTVMLVWMCSMSVSVSAASGDNSLSTLGITTEGAIVSPDFYYSTIEYNVTVPEGTAALELTPVTSHQNASIVYINGTELVDGETTVEIRVAAENGNEYSYYLYVEADASAGTVTPVAETEPETEPQTETETEPETEDPRYVKVDRNTLMEAENSIAALKEEANSYRDRLSMLMNILYGLIGFSVVLLFVVINLILKKRDLKKEVETYRGYGYPQEMNDYGYEQRGYERVYEEQYEQQGYEPEYGQEEAYAQMSRKELKQARKDAKKEEKLAAKMEAKQAKLAKKGKAVSQEMYDQEAYDQNYDQAYDQNGYDQAYDQNGYDQNYDPNYYEPENKMPVKDDPETVPKPAKARKKAKKMPKYENAPQEYDYQPQQGGSREDVEVTMIDL